MLVSNLAWIFLTYIETFQLPFPTTYPLNTRMMSQSMKVKGLIESQKSVTKDVKNIGKNFLKKMTKNFVIAYTFFTENLFNQWQFRTP